MKKAMLSYAACLAAVILTACQWFSQPGYRVELPPDIPPPPGAVLVERKPDGIMVYDVPPVKGGVDQAADAAKAAGVAGVPWAGLAGSVLGVIGVIGTWFTRRDKAMTLKAGVELLNELKPMVANMAGDEDLKKFLKVWAEKNKFAGDVTALYDKLKLSAR